MTLCMYAGAVQVWGGEVYVRGSTDFLVNTAGEKGGEQGLDILPYTVCAALATIL